ncbi:MAG: hypothetical protein LC776_04320 [Acidobacteria bacterium]|nr:hypothetical protein [Acidobacteriota bacterium]
MFIVFQRQATNCVAEDGTTMAVERRDGNQASDEFSLIEYNLSLFFGLAVPMYEATLVSDDTPFDRHSGPIDIPARTGFSST